MSDPAGNASTATAEITVNTVNAVDPVCLITITGPSSAAIGPALHLTASASCNSGTPEIQWQHRAGTSGTFQVFKAFNTQTFADFVTTGAAPGTHQFRALARAVGATRTTTSNTLGVTLQGTAPPTAMDDTLVVDEDHKGTVNVLANDSDPDGDALTASITTPPAAGTATISGGVITYTPAANYNGGDSIGYTVNDGHGNTATATVHITVNPVEDPPSAHHDFLTVAEDTSGSIDVTANDVDVDGDALTVTAISQPSDGTATLTGNVVTYTPDPDFNGSDAMEYTVSDGHGGTSTASVFITVTPANDPPRATDDVLTTPEDTEGDLFVLGNDSDPDRDPLTVVSFTQPAHGSVTISAGFAAYVPAPDYNGQDAFMYTIADPSGLMSTATVRVTVLPVNDPPVANADAASLDEDTSAAIDVVANDTDIDLDPLTVASVTQPGHGTVAISSGHAVTYTPAPDYNGQDAFTYTVADPSGATASAAVTVTVNPVNDPPIANADAASLDEDTSAVIDVVANDTDIDRDPMTVTAVTQPTHGTAAVVDATHVSYTPEANYNGSDSFSYTIDDGHGAQASAAVNVTVRPVNDPPTASDVVVVAFNDNSTVVTLSGSDIDRDALSFAIASGPEHGTLGPVIGATVSYTPDAGFLGADAFTFVASDGIASSAPATVHITVSHSTCGNGVREGREECDDGNAIAGDGCESTCLLTCGSGTGAERDAVDPASGHCFAAYDGVSHSYQRAAAMCLAVGGHLPSLTSASEDAAAFSAVHAGDAPWLGADDVAVEGTFHWLTGEAFGYSHFATGKPDNAGGADCVRYQPDGTWTDAPCGATSGTLCEIEIAVTTPALATGGGGTQAAAVADLNGDGYADIAAVNPANTTVGILLGDGAGGFALAGTAPTGSGPVAIASGDFDRDGNLDLAVVNATANTVSILHGAGDGSFTTVDTVAIAANATAIATADFNGDGALDLIVTAGSAVQQLRNDGSGGFTAQPTLPLLGALAGIAVGDFNRDGVVDAAVTTPIAILVLLGTGGGGFGLPVTLTLAGGRGILATDLDGDGNLDLAVTDGTASVSLLFGTGTGSFGGTVALTASGATQVIAGDFDGDGSSDLVALSPGVATLYHGSGRTFTRTATAFATGGSGANFGVAANLNGDTATDLVVANAASSTAGVLLGGASGFTGARALVAGSGDSGTVTGDFNGDGLTDLVVIDAAAGKAYAFMQGAGGALVQTATITTQSSGLSSAAIAIDANGDGHLDLAIVNGGGGSMGVALGNGRGGFDDPINVGTLSSPRRAVAVDFNGDHFPDLAVASPGGVSILVNAGGGFFGNVGSVAAGATPTAIAAGDFNGDGKQDLVVATSGEASVKLLLGDGGAGFAAAVAFPVASGGLAIAAGDLDGDGKLDVVATGTSTGTVSILHNLGGGSFAPAVTLQVGGAPSAVAIVDIDGDGRPDIATSNAGTSDLTVLHAAPDGSYVASSYALGASPSGLSIGDLDHDGHLDFAAPSNGGFVTTVYSGR